MRTLLKNAILLVEKDRWETVPRGFLGINDQRIDYLDAIPPAQSYDHEIDLENHLILPGFFNLHAHTGMTSLRGIGSGLPLHRWLKEAMFPREAKFSPSDIQHSSQIAILEMIASGIVSFSDMYIQPWLTAALVETSGMKANLSVPFASKDFSRPEIDQERVDTAVKVFQEYHQSAEERIRIDFAIHAEYTSLKASARTYSEACRSCGARMHLHLAETEADVKGCIERHGVTPAAFFAGIGTFENPTNAAHCVVLSDADIEILREKGVAAIHNPSSNMKLGSGFMPIRKLMDAGVPVVLGTDSTASNNNLNFLEEIHLASLIHCGAAHDPTILSAEEVLTMATSAGAAAQGRNDTGRLKVGNKADLAIFDLDRPHLMPVHDAPALIVYAAQASDIVCTIVDGKMIYDHGEYLTVDVEKAKADYRQSCARIH